MHTFTCLCIFLHLSWRCACSFLCITEWAFGEAGLYWICSLYSDTPSKLHKTKISLISHRNQWTSAHSIRCHVEMQWPGQQNDMLDFFILNLKLPWPGLSSKRDFESQWDFLDKERLNNNNNNNNNQKGISTPHKPKLSVTSRESDRIWADNYLQDHHTELVPCSYLVICCWCSYACCLLLQPSALSAVQRQQQMEKRQRRLMGRKQSPQILSLYKPAWLKNRVPLRVAQTHRRLVGLG